MYRKSVFYRIKKFRKNRTVVKRKIILRILPHEENKHLYILFLRQKKVDNSKPQSYNINYKVDYSKPKRKREDGYGCK